MKSSSDAGVTIVYRRPDRKKDLVFDQILFFGGMSPKPGISVLPKVKLNELVLTLIIWGLSVTHT
jgi:hypothetical protein